jgi:hypothetical protein
MCVCLLLLYFYSRVAYPRSPDLRHTERNGGDTSVTVVTSNTWARGVNFKKKRFGKAGAGREISARPAQAICSNGAGNGSGLGREGRAVGCAVGATIQGAQVCSHHLVSLVTGTDCLRRAPPLHLTATCLVGGSKRKMATHVCRRSPAVPFALAVFSIKCVLLKSENENVSLDVSSGEQQNNRKICIAL